MFDQFSYTIYVMLQHSEFWGPDERANSISLIPDAQAAHVYF